MENFETESQKVKDFAEKHLKEETGVDVEVFVFKADDFLKNQISKAEKLLERMIDFSDLLPNKVVGKSRVQKLVYFRHQAISIISLLFPLISLKRRGLMFGGRDHSTVIHSIQTNQDLCDTDKEYKAQYDDLMKFAKDFLFKNGL